MARELKRERSATVRDAGISTIEVVILTPLIIFMVLIIVAFGILEDANGAVDDAASDAARAGSLERSQTDALAAAQAAATADLAGWVQGELTDLARRFDGRNGNDSCARRIDELQELKKLVTPHSLTNRKASDEQES